MLCRQKARVPFVLAVILTFLGGVWPAPALAHLDPPGPPELEVSVTAESLRLTQDQDDGFDGNAELLLMANTTHVDHGQDTRQFKTDDYSWDTVTYAPPNFRRVLRRTAPDWWLKAQHPTIWKHTECSPRSTVTVGTTLIEVDTELTDQVVGALASTAAGTAAGAAYGAAFGGTGAIPGAIVGFIVSLAASLNGNDDLGVGSGTIPDNGTKTVESRGPDGGADIKFSGTTTAYDRPCNPTSTEHAYLTPGDRAALIFRPMEQAVAAIPGMRAEPGNPAQLTEAQLEDIRRTWTRTAMGLAEAAVGAEVEAAKGYVGYAPAAEMFLAARELDGLDPAAALELYEGAFMQAVVARDETVPADGEVEPALHFSLSLTPDFISTKPGRNPVVLASALGAAGPVALTVSELPAGMDAEISAVSDGSSVYQVTLSIGDVVPGMYTVRLNAADGLQGTERELTVVVNPAPSEETFANQVPGVVQLVPGDVDITFQADGSRKAVVTVGSASLIEAVTEAENVVTVDLADLAEAAVVFVEGRGLARVLEMGKSLLAKTGKGGVSIGTPALDLELLAGSLETTADKLVVEISIFGETSEETNRIARAAEAAGATVMVPADGIGFSVSAANPATGETIAVGHFGRQFAEQSLELSQVPIHGKTAGAVLTEGGLRPVPTTFDGTKAVLKANRPGTFTVVTRNVGFADTGGHWAEEYVQVLADKLIVQGVGQNRFEPNRPVVRAEAIAIIARSLGLSLRSTGIFPDVPREAWHNGEVGAAADFGLVEGYADGTFNPNGRITRAEGAAILVRLMEAVLGDTLAGTVVDLDRFADREEFPTWAEPYLAKAVGQGLLRGYVGGRLEPGRTITRAELATMVRRTLEAVNFLDTTS